MLYTCAMDELTIDERKYISSKRAAEITGYAKDYVGQLCRGGYVPARRIGRNWYVLESAIKDHRFGAVAEENLESAIVEQPRAPQTPRYVALDTQFSEPVNLLRRDSVTPDSGTSANTNQPTQGDFQEAWQAWFEMFRGREHAEVVNVDAVQAPIEPIANMEEEPFAEPVPLRVLASDMPPRGPGRAVVHAQPTLPPPESHQNTFRSMPPATKRRKKFGSRWLIRTIVILITLVFIGSAILGTGFFDNTIASSNTASLFSGAVHYDK